MTFAASAATWQNFYILVATAAATLVGLMFVAVTFGSSLVTEKTSPTARSFLDPTFTHFVQVLLTGCLVTIPTMTPRLLAILLFVGASSRISMLVRVHRHMKEAQKTSNDIELSDWVTGIILPTLCYLMLIGAGISFISGGLFAFNILAVATVLILLTGIFSAWELLVWMAIARSRVK